MRPEAGTAKLFALVTSQLPSGADQLQCFLSSASDPNIRVLCLLQGANDPQSDILVANNPGVRFLHTQEHCGLSAARNQLLDELSREVTVSPSDLVGFPDDDCTYLPGTARSILAAFGMNTEPTARAFIYADSATGLPAPQFDGSIAGALVGPRLVNTICSITLVINVAAWRLVGGFDERLGVGTVLGSGEDSDYGLRLRAAGCAVVHVREIVASHPVKRSEPARYAAGAVALAVKHLRISDPPSLVIFTRTVLGGIRLVARGHGSVMRILDALRRGLTLRH